MPHPLDPVFHPRSIAVVGASPRGPQVGIGTYMPSLVDQGYHEEHALYPVNPRGEAVEGIPAYTSLLECPDPVDHVISQVPARAVPEVVEQAIAKRVRSVHFFTAGFSETGDATMAAQEREFVGRLTAAGIRVIGPNCLGLYVPGERITFMKGFPQEPGNVFLLSQSGSNTAGIIRAVAPRGVRFSKAVSFGNGSDVDAAELLDYALADPETEVIAGYLEGVGDGRAFAAALRRCAARKPVILLKGGRHPDGARAANSHTGSLAGSFEVFDALCRQAGALRANNMDELQDLIVAVTTPLPATAGPRIGMAGGPGGFAVLSSDALADAGLRVPALPAETVDALHEIVPVAGSSANNPIDANVSDEDWLRVYRHLAESPVIDTVVGTNLGQRSVPAEAVAALATIQRETGVPFVGVQRSFTGPAVGSEGDEFAALAHAQGVAVFANVERAARVIAALIAWRHQREDLPALSFPAFAG